MIVINNTKRLIILSTASGNIPLTVGSNPIPDSTPMDGAAAKMLLDEGDISIPGGIPEGGNGSVDFSKLKQAEAIQVVENTFDKDALESYFEQTRNNQVKAAIKARIAVIEDNDRKTAEALAKKTVGDN